MVTPLIRTYMPAAVVQTSPLTGDVGATPVGMFKPDFSVVDAAVPRGPVMTPPVIGSGV